MSLALLPGILVSSPLSWFRPRISHLSHTSVWIPQCLVTMWQVPLGTPACRRGSVSLSECPCSCRKTQEGSGRKPPSLATRTLTPSQAWSLVWYMKDSSSVYSSMATKKSPALTSPQPAPQQWQVSWAVEHPSLLPKSLFSASHLTQK